MNNSQKTYRLFFALWPSNQVRQAIVDAFSDFSPPPKGRVIQPQNLHISLHFIGSVTEANKDCMHAAARTVNASPFKCSLDHFGCFPRAKILWMGCREVPEALTELHRTLGMVIAPCGYQQEQRAYLPHVTLMRKCVKPELAQRRFSVPWFIDEFVLVESVTHQHGAEYRVIEKYSL